MSDVHDTPPQAPIVEVQPGPAADLAATAPAAPLRSKFDRSIVEGPISTAVWRLAWPTVLQNMIGGLQGLIDHVLVGHFVGYTANAAIGVSWQIFVVVIVFISSIYTGMGVLVARFAGANQPDKVDRVVYQAFLASLFLSIGVLAPVGYLAAPKLLMLVNAAPEVQVEALPFLRTMFVFVVGMAMFFMISGALRAAGDARTPLRLGVMMTVMNVLLNIVFIRGLGPIPAFGTQGAAIGTVIASCTVAVVGLFLIFSGRSVVHFSRSVPKAVDWTIIRSLFKFGLPTGLQGIAMNIGGVFLLRFIGSLEHSAQAQAAYAVTYSELFSLITWTSVGLMGAAAAVAGQNLGAGRPDRSIQAVDASARLGLGVAAVMGLLFTLIPRQLLGLFGLTDPIVVQLGRQLLAYLTLSGFFVTVALTYTGGLQGTGDTRSPLYISIVSQLIVPLTFCGVLQSLGQLDASDVWLAIVLGHFTRCVLSVARFRQGKWKGIAVELKSAH